MKIRDAVRAIVLDPDNRTVLVHFDFGRRVVWATPGGGVNPGESDEQALRRELAEEVGLEDPAIGPHVWVREHLFQNPLGLRQEVAAHDDARLPSEAAQRRLPVEERQRRPRLDHVRHLGGFETLDQLGHELR